MRELHHHVAAAVGRVADVDDADDVRVLEPPAELGLAIEALQRRRVRDELGVQQLHRERAADLDVARAIDRAGRAATERFLDAVARREHFTEDLHVEASMRAYAASTR